MTTISEEELKEVNNFIKEDTPNLIDLNIDNNLEKIYTQKEDNYILNEKGYIINTKYDANDASKLVMVIESITEATRKIENSSFTHIKICARNKTPYLGYRWHLINRNDPNPYEPKVS